MEEILIFVQQEIWLVAALGVLIGLLMYKESASAGEKMSLNQVVQALNAEKAVLVDVRDAKDFDSGHVAQAINVPHSKLNAHLNLLDKYKEKQIIITDALGQHAATVSRTLAKEGYKVARMVGGISEWKQQGLPLVRPK